MALIERVSTLLRADIKDLLDRAEDPEITLKQLILDMDNQLLQVKTQVAIALADQYLLEKETVEQQQSAGNWRSKAELAVSNGDDALARVAVLRAVSCETNLNAYRVQMADHIAEAEALRASYAQLQAKLVETRSECERLIAKHRLARLHANIAASHAQRSGETQAIGHFQSRLHAAEIAVEATQTPLPSENVEQRFEELKNADQIEKLLSELKLKRQSLLPTG